MTKREGSLEAPTRHPIQWEDPAFIDSNAIDEEMRRVFDICHGCRRCFNLCDSFPSLFDLIDNTTTGEVDALKSEDFPKVADSCTLCDMCFMTKCPYVPPHEFDVDFPHLMLRYKAAQNAQGKTSWTQKELAKTDRNGNIAASPIAPIVNWGANNKAIRTVMEKATGIDKRAHLPSFQRETFVRYHKKNPIPLNEKARAYGKKVVLYVTCLGNYNQTTLPKAARAVLAHNGIETEVIYPKCCGMPVLESGNLKKVAEGAHIVSQTLTPWIEKGYDVVSLVPSCSLMFKNEWPLLLPGNEAIKTLSESTFDISEYLIMIEKTVGLMKDFKPIKDGITLHHACHARAQNMGAKAYELLSKIPDVSIHLIERCSGHGGSFGLMHLETALKVGKPVVKQAIEKQNHWVLSECPLAATHIKQGIDFQDPNNTNAFASAHPIEILALAYGLENEVWDEKNNKL